MKNFVIVLCDHEAEFRDIMWALLGANPKARASAARVEIENTVYLYSDGLDLMRLRGLRVTGWIVSPLFDKRLADEYYDGRNPRHRTLRYLEAQRQFILDEDLGSGSTADSKPAEQGSTP